ncbi:MAG: HDOD domain-containing protein [Desulfomonilia bacterium]|jgi:HD-like signal output (HDOD) protein
MGKLSPEQIESILDNVGELPTLPSIATAIMEKTMEANVNARQIAELVEKDQALALKVLKVANSPFYRRIKEISTIRGAVVLLGFNVLKSIVLSISVINLFNEKERRVLDFYKFWQHSIACAVCAKSIAARILPASSEDAFVAGLLHDLGKVIADQLICKHGEYNEVFEAMNRAGADIIEIEQDLLGIDHASIGKYLMERWNLPGHLSKAVGYHHSIIDITDDVQTKRLCSIIHVADMVANHLGLGMNPTQTGFIDPSLLNQLNLTSQDIQDISISLKDNISNISDELGIPTAEPKTYFEVLQTANAQLGKLSLDLEQKKMALERRTLELSNLNQMSTNLQASIKLSEILNIIASHTLTILDAKKTRCLIRLNNLRIMVTESFVLGESPQTKTGVASATKELLDRTNGIFPRSGGIIFAALKVDGKTIGAIEVLLKDNLVQDEINQKALLLRTIAEVSSQAIQRAMLITKNMKAQRLAAVTKTAIAANHEINSPLTTILLKLDMLTGERQLSPAAKNIVAEIKGEAMAIRNVVKKMLEISDVVETTYAQNEKMLDLKGAVKGASPGPSAKGRTHPQNDVAGFEDYIEERPKGEAGEQVSKPGTIEQTPGFEDYLEDKPKVTSDVKAASRGSGTNSDTPGFEDYLDK